MAATCMIYDQRLKGELTLRPTLYNGNVVSRTCTRCRDELGRIINRGACCPSCGQRVCKSCRQYGNSPTQWLCTVCHIRKELRSTTGEWMNELINEKQRAANATETIKRSIQRSWTFSDVSPSPWSFLRGSPEMRAYSSMPRHQDVEYVARPTKEDPLRAENIELPNQAELIVNKEEETAPHDVDVTDDVEIIENNIEVTQIVDDKKDVLEQSTAAAFFKKVALKVDSRSLPAGVTPPRSRRRLLKSDISHEDYLAETCSSFSEKCLDPDDYRMVFISSSDSSSREELHSDDCSSTTSGGLLDWDYFECWGGQKKSIEGVEVDSVHRVASVSPAPVQCVRVPVPFPFPVPVPVFLPFPVAVPSTEMTTSRGCSLPQSEVLPRDEVLSNNTKSPLVDQELNSRSDGDCESVVLTVYKNLESAEDPPPISSPESILRVNEAKLKDFTALGDDSSVSSISSDEEDENRTPSTRIYKLNHSSDESSGEFSLVATPPASASSSSSSSDSSDEDSTSGKFLRTLIIHESSDDEDANDIDPTEKTPEEEEDKKSVSEVDNAVTTDHSLLSEQNDKVENTEEPVENEQERSNFIDSIITFSHTEVCQIVREFLEEESKCLVEKKEVTVVNKSCDMEVDSVLPESRSNTSDEFSGTESMEMPLEDSLECGGQEGGSKKAGGESGRYTSLVMITQQQGGPKRPEEEESNKVTVVTGSNTLSAVVCLEEGLADDDSWVEDLDREDNVTTTEESSEDEPYQDREEELRGYHRTIDFTLHTIAEESCEESEVEGEKNRPTELEKYFFYGLGDNTGNCDDKEDTMSETSSIYSEGVESSVGAEEPQDNVDPAELASSRLEKYFLSGFMGFNRRDSDGSVGSDSEGRPSPEHRRKRLVRARGTGRQHSNSLDNLVESTEVEIQIDVGEGSSTETDSHDEQSNSFDKVDGQFDTVKRTKKKKRSVPSAQADLAEVVESGSKEDLTDDGKQTPQPECQPSELLNPRNKQASRDSGFVGSCDDLLKDSNDQPNKSEEPSPPNNQKLISDKAQSSPPPAALIRKDSFNNWSSDEETNLMMSKMRAFFKTMVGNQPKGTSPDVKPKVKPPQLVYFESELTRLMKTVPGLRDEQVREIVEYLSSEDTWSDSYDSSDYTSSDLENSNKRSALQEEISASCRQIISNFETSNEGLELPETNKDSAMVYQRLVASFSKMEVPKNDSGNQNSPLLIEKVMQHIGSRLWALMHEVSGGEGSSPRIGRYQKRISSKLSASTTEEEEDSVEDYSPLPRSKSHDPLLEENRQETSDNERFSWRGSFESALMASDSRTRLASGGESSASASALALAAKRRSAGDLMFKSYSREQLDRVRSCGSIGGSVEDRIWSREEKRRRSSVPDSPSGSAGDDDSEEDEPGGRATLPRSLQASCCSSATNSLPRLPTTPTSTVTPIYKSHSVHQFSVKSARYRPPGYRNSPLAPPPRRDRRRNVTSSCSNNGCDDSSICSEPIVSRGTDEEVDRLLCQRASLGVSKLDDRSSLLNYFNDFSKELPGEFRQSRSDSLASVYSGAGEGRHGGVTVRGEVQFGLQYNYKQSCLEIHVKQCKDLAPVDIKRNRSDPYVKVYLLPDKSKSGKRKTRVKKHTLNPVFDEILKFQISLDELEHRTLWLSVWHSDMFGRNDFLGEVLMLLEKKVFDNPNPDTYQLQERSEPLEELNSKGELIVGLKYETPDSNSNKKRPSKGCLYVLVKEAKNLPPVKTNGTSDPFCKCYLLPDKGRGSKQKAPVLRKTCNPAWNHTFTYNNVSIEELAERSIELTIWDHDRLASNEFLGGVRLNVGSGKHHDKNVDWMDSNGNEITLWKRMMEKPNLWVESCLPLRPSLDMRSTL